MARCKEFDEESTLEKAMCVFWSKGFAATSMQDLVDAMGINRQSIYDTYGDKHRLFIASLKHAQKKMLPIESSALFTGKDTAKQVIEIYFEKVIDEIVTDKENRGCIMANSILELVPEDEAVKKIARQNYDFLENCFRDIIEKGIARKEIRTDKSPVALSTHLVNTMHGLRLTGKLKKDRKELREIVDIALGALDN